MWSARLVILGLLWVCVYVWLLAIISVVMLALAMGRPAAAAPVSALSDLVEVDQLGFACIPEDDLEAAFRATGKGVRLPQTCIADPCAQLLGEVEFGSLLGRPADAAEFADYRGRMTRVCGAPTIWAERGITEEQLLTFIFGGAPIHLVYPPLPGATPVPVPGGIILLGSAIGCGVVRAVCSRRSRCCVA